MNVRPFRYACVHVLAAASLALTTLACSNSSSGSSTGVVTAPSSPSLNLAGSWSGTMGKQGGDNKPMKVSWAATQNGANVSGPIQLEINFGSDSQPNNQTINGTLAGTIAGSQVSLTMTLPPGAFTQIGSAACSVSGTGSSSTATANSVVATMNVTFAAPCVGVVTDPGKNSEVDQLSLSKP